MRWSFLIVVGLTAQFAAAAPVVVVVDTSRSVRAGELAMTRDALRRDLRQLPTDTPVGVMAFNDAPRWLAAAASSPDEAAAVLDELVPEGRHTVLQDALFVAARALPDGGTILVVSDGRDENSATTVEDVVRRCVDQRIRLVTACQGHRVDDRTLRRLALLTDGTYLGPITSASPVVVASALARGEGGPRAAAPPQPMATATDATDSSDSPTTGAATTSPTIPRWTPVAASLIAVLACIAAAWFLLARRPEDRRRCGDCGATLEPWERECAACQIRELEAALTADAGDGRILGPADTIQVGPAPQLLVRERGGPARLVHLPPDGVFPVGRAPEVNALVVRDPTVSGRHFKLVQRDGEWYVIDLETTNGTTVNGRRTRFHRLRPGDVIQAGTTRMTFDIRVRRVG